MNALVDALAGRAVPRNAEGWNGLIAAARAELMLGSLAYVLEGADVPPKVAALLADARAKAEQNRVTALWEAEMARRALAPVGCPIILLKGTASAAAGLAASRGRSIGDLDILVPRGALGEVERALLAAGWEWVKPDRYDDAYYREHMHELPPLIHRERDRMIDVHHTILPLTARVRPDAEALIAGSIALPNGLRVLSPADMVLHCVAHLFADGDLAGGLRNLWDFDRLMTEFGHAADFWATVVARAERHGLRPHLERALRLARSIYFTDLEGAPGRYGRLSPADRLFRRRLLARDWWGRETRLATRLGFYVRSHWLRMPPVMLARHLWTKARR